MMHSSVGKIVRLLLFVCLATSMHAIAYGLSLPSKSGNATPESQVKLPCAHKPLKVLMIGNSFSICVLKYAPEIASDLGCRLDIASLYIGGCSLERHWNNVVAATTNATFKPYRYYRITEGQRIAEKGYSNIPDALTSEKWDIVTIQQCSHKSWNPETYHPYADRLIAEIRKLAPQAEIVIQQTWSYNKGDRRITNPENDGPGSWGFDQTGMFERLKAAYDALAKDYGLRVIPMGLAVQNFRKARGIVSSQGDVVGKNKDTIHLNKNGEYLQGLVWVGTLFGKDVTKVSFAPKGMPNDLAVTLRDCANRAVKK